MPKPKKLAPELAVKAVPYHPSPSSLASEIAEAGKFFEAFSPPSTPDDIVAMAQQLEVVALQLTSKDLGVVDRLNNVRFLQLASDGRPNVDPLNDQNQLESLAIYFSGIGGGTLDVNSLPKLRWLTLNAPGKGAESTNQLLSEGHENLEHLVWHHFPSKSFDALKGVFPSVTYLRIESRSLRHVGDIKAHFPNVNNLTLSAPFRSVDGLEELTGLEALSISTQCALPASLGSKLPNLQYAAPFDSTDLVDGSESLEAFEGHQTLRVVRFNQTTERLQEILQTLPCLESVVSSWGYDGPWPELSSLPEGDRSRQEWQHYVNG